MAIKQRRTKKTQRAVAVQKRERTAPVPTQTGTVRSYQRERNRRARIRRRRHRLFMIFCVILVCAASVFATTVFFRVSDVKVDVETRYDTDELITASGIQTGDNMAFLHTKRIAQQLEQMYPYMQDVKVHRQLPSTVTITFTERVPILSVQNGEKYLLVDETGRVLEEKKKVKKNTIEILGVNTDGLTEGGFVTQDSSKELYELLQLVQLLQNNDLSKDITAIDRNSAKDIRMTYQDRYTILMGELYNTEHKIQFLLAILKEPTLPHNGVIDLTNEKEARYRPDEVDITEDQADFETPEEQAQRIAAEQAANEKNADTSSDTQDTNGDAADASADSNASDIQDSSSDTAGNDAEDTSSETSGQDEQTSSEQ